MHLKVLKQLIIILILRTFRLGYYTLIINLSNPFLEDLVPVADTEGVHAGQSDRAGPHRRPDALH